MNTTNGADEHRCIYRLMPRLHVHSPPAQSSRVRATSNHARRGISHSSYFFPQVPHQMRRDCLWVVSALPRRHAIQLLHPNMQDGNPFCPLIEKKSKNCQGGKRRLCFHPKTPVFSPKDACVPPINTPVFLLKDACVFLQTQLSFSKLQQRHDLLFRIMPPTYYYSVLKSR